MVIYRKGEGDRQSMDRYSFLAAVRGWHCFEQSCPPYGTLSWKVEAENC